MPLQPPSPLTKRQTNLMLSLPKHEATRIQPNSRGTSPVYGGGADRRRGPLTHTKNKTHPEVRTQVSLEG
jgi:hypothetical protein